MKNWFEIIIGIYLLGMILYGHYRGAIRIAVSMVAFIATFLIVHIAMPSMTVFVKNQTPIYGWIQESLKDALIPEENGEELFDEREILGNLNLPQEVQELLLEHHEVDLYNALGIHTFAEYVSDYVAGLIVRAAGFVILFFVVYVVVHVLMRWLDLMARLPIVSGVNKLAGALLGGIQGLFFVWLFLLLVMAFSTSGWASQVITQIESSKWLSFLYHYNVLSRLVLGFIKGIF